MMVLIMTNINYSVILISSTVFLLSSFVSSQSKLTNYKDPAALYNHAVYLNRHAPEFYEKVYRQMNEKYMELINAEHKRNSMDKRAFINNGQPIKKDKPVNIRAPNSPIPKNPSPKADHQPRNPKFSRSFSSIETTKPTALLKEIRGLPVTGKREMKFDGEWNQHCMLLGYNNTNNICKGDPHEEIKEAPDEEICRNYLEFGCQYRSEQTSCVTSVDAVMKDEDFDCDKIRDDTMSFQCCMSCKGGINAAITNDECDMHKDSSFPSLALESCCKETLRLNKTDTTTESVSTLKPDSMNAIIANLDERLSNNTMHNLEINSSTIPATSPLPTTSTITTTTVTPTTVTLPTTEAPTTSTTTATTTTTTAPTTTTTPTSTTTEPTTTTTTTTTESAAKTTTTSASLVTLSVRNAEMDFSDKNLEIKEPLSKRDEIREGYREIEDENEFYEKIDVEDVSKADYLVILSEKLNIENGGDYNNFKLMNLTLRSNSSCDWEFNLESANALGNLPTLRADNFTQFQEGFSFILLLSGEVKPQKIEYTVSCNVDKYKYYKYYVFLDFVDPK